MAEPHSPTLCMIEGCENVATIRHPTRQWHEGELEPMLCETCARVLTFHKEKMTGGKLHYDDPKAKVRKGIEAAVAHGKKHGNS